MNVGIWMIFGVAAGTAVGAGFDNIPAGIAVGAGLGAAMWAAMQGRGAGDDDGDAG